MSFFDGLLRLKQFLEVSPTTELLFAELFDASSTGTKHKYCRIILLIQKAGIMKLQNMISLITEVHHSGYLCVNYLLYVFILSFHVPHVFQVVYCLRRKFPGQIFVILS
jgi:hypothetical protein